MKVETTSPADHVGAVISSVAGKAGQVIVAHVPLAMFGYVGALRSLSCGRAGFSMVLDHYARVPRAIADDLRAAC